MDKDKILFDKIFLIKNESINPLTNAHILTSLEQYPPTIYLQQHYYHQE